jgi:dipeptidyl aminopeptidase/acylaminoacyl peptidase
MFFTRETHTGVPEYHVGDRSLENGKRLTDSNPEIKELAWSSGAQLVNYTTAKGDKLQGALYLPANYERGKSYPTIVYIYERLSQSLNQFKAPRANGFNEAYYTSNGYAVFEPDIKYRVNDPGMSAVWSVVPAVKAAIATGIVDAAKVGIQGHSWGGYQTSFLVTQTDIFAAAVAGAPLTNMISMYSLIYKNSGGTNQAIFESSQGRFYGGYWDNLEAYMRNSPVFHAKNVKTPLMILHNDRDGAVDFTQGVEYFNTLRRLGKPVVMLEYVGENHGLRRPVNQQDYTVRMKEYFDHHLMGKAAPEWLTKGVPRLQMEEHLRQRQQERKAAPDVRITTEGRREGGA